MLSASVLVLLGLTPQGSVAGETVSPSALLGAPGSIALVQDPSADKRPEVSKLIDELDAHASKKGAEDTEAVATIDKLNQEFPASGPKDKAAIVKALSKCFEERRLEKEGEPPNNKMFLAAAVALGQMAPESPKTLMQWIGHKDLRKDLALQHRLILSLGKTKDKAGLKTLMMNLENKTPSLVSAAAEALAEFADADQPTRKEAFESMLKVLMSAKGSKDIAPEDTIAAERYDIVSAPIITSLTRLAKHEERDAEKWQTWWNKNKKAEWNGEEK